MLLKETGGTEKSGGATRDVVSRKLECTEHPLIIGGQYLHLLSLV